MWVGPSNGATCDACGRQIAPAEIECEAVIANSLELHLDHGCYRLLLEEKKARQSNPGRAA